MEQHAVSVQWGFHNGYTCNFQHDKHRAEQRNKTGNSISLLTITSTLLSQCSWCFRIIQEKLYRHRVVLVLSPDQQGTTSKQKDKIDSEFTAQWFPKLWITFSVWMCCLSVEVNTLWLWLFVMNTWNKMILPCCAVRTQFISSELKVETFLLNQNWKLNINLTPSRILAQHYRKCAAKLCQINLLQTCLKR